MKNDLKFWKVKWLLKSQCRLKRKGKYNPSWGDKSNKSSIYPNERNNKISQDENLFG